jgi:hypothetical protein
MLNDAARASIDSAALAHLATIINEDGSPQVVTRVGGMGPWSG